MHGKTSLYSGDTEYFDQLEEKIKEADIHKSIKSNPSNFEFDLGKTPSSGYNIVTQSTSSGIKSGGYMVQGKPFKELDLSDAFLFAAALQDEKTCQLVLENVCIDTPLRKCAGKQGNP